jgi:hypothetical protein
MRHLLFAFVAVLLATGPSIAGEVKRLGLDDPSPASPQIAADTEVKVEGHSALKITARWPVTVSIGEVGDIDVENARLVYTARVKSELEGSAYLEMWAHLGGNRYFSRGMNDSVGGITDWKTIRTPFMFQKGQKPDKVTLNLVINGTGTVWIDDVVLLEEPL